MWKYLENALNELLERSPLSKNIDELNRLQIERSRENRVLIDKVLKSIEEQSNTVRSLQDSVSLIEARLDGLAQLNVQIDSKTALDALVDRSGRFDLIDANISKSMADLDILRQEVGEVGRNIQNQSGDIGRLEFMSKDLSALRRSAPGRGNTMLSEERLLTRLSMPEYFQENEPIYIVNADDRLILPKLAMTGYYELGSTRYVAMTIKPEDHVIDVGANFGYYSVLFGRLVGWKGRVLSFEPEPRMFRLLKENLVANWIETWVQALNLACGDSVSDVTFYTSLARSANAGPRIPNIDVLEGAGFEFTPFQAHSVPLDASVDYLQGRVNFLKIDVEGGEPLVLKGARQIIANNPQIKIMMEWSPGQIQLAGHDVGDFVSLMESMNLTCNSIDSSGKLHSLDFSTLLASNSYQNVVLTRALDD